MNPNHSSTVPTPDLYSYPPSTTFLQAPALLARLASSKMPRGRLLLDRTVHGHNCISGRRGRCNSRPRPSPSTGPAWGRQIAINRTYIFYSRVLNINTALWWLLHRHCRSPQPQVVKMNASRRRRF